MGLSLLDCKVGTIVDHSFERREDGKVLVRPLRRRGIIVGLEGEGDSITAVKVKFGEGKPTEKINAYELVRVHAANTRIAQEAYKRVMNIPTMVGEQFDVQKIVAKPKLVDELCLTRAPKQGDVEPELEREPIVAPEVESKASE